MMAYLKIKQSEITTAFAVVTETSPFLFAT
jgi:hypothetical protein